MAVFRERIGNLDGKDAKANFRTVQEYLDYMVEQIELSNRTLQKTVNEQKREIEALKAVISSLQA